MVQRITFFFQSSFPPILPMLCRIVATTLVRSALKPNRALAIGRPFLTSTFPVFQAVGGGDFVSPKVMRNELDDFEDDEHRELPSDKEIVRELTKNLKTEIEEDKVDEFVEPDDEL